MDGFFRSFVEDALRVEGGFGCFLLLYVAAWARANGVATLP